MNQEERYIRKLVFYKQMSAGSQQGLSQDVRDQLDALAQLRFILTRAHERFQDSSPPRDINDILSSFGVRRQEDRLRDLIIRAIETQNLRNLDRWLSGGDMISDTILREAFTTASRVGNQELIERIRRTRSTLFDYDALISAINNAEITWANQLLQHLPDISATDRDTMLALIQEKQGELLDALETRMDGLIRALV